ncbi:MAG: c-type cytochrome, partial [Dehalococcoidia bacterium]
SCHGRDGRGNLGMGPALNNQTFLRVVSDGFLWEAIAKGRRDTPMFPSLKGLDGVRQLSPEEVNDLVAFIRSWEKP